MGDRFVWDGESPIPVSEWGKDHWSTFAYIETRCVDHQGWIDGDKMRCHPRLHRSLMGRHQVDFAITGEGYPTRLRGDATAVRHDDWSCAEDMVSAGLIEPFDEIEPKFGEVFGGGRIRVRITPEGQRIAGHLRHHKAMGGAFGTFTLEPDHV